MEQEKLSVLINEASIKLQEPITSSESLNLWKVKMFTLINEIAALKLATKLLPCESIASLDPSDWTLTQSVAHEMLDLSLEHIRFVRNRPIWQPVPEHIRVALEDEPFPQHGQSLLDVCDAVTKYIMPYSRGKDAIHK
ncbi:unnamed protein product [Rotaria socialis]|uniref:Uncharacterized protein n=1 Tax=Rotaria socialis TaxID=392032 RepID=A0A821DZC6_9BILA|nr:unnamed protein product [Rotaria socialis]CAF3320151.1 unnamed protein product [Rotaria socialis]CAF3331876.1 unnamed protein product [Rotaria socialis]CAF3417049.1 unnamed protein product [Rotaria socialis]CAF4466676.1 unnamed protein product [Rotaria socialis]